MYHCRDCGHRTRKSNEKGGCPACGSQQFGRKMTKNRPPSKPNRLHLIGLVVLWGYLLAHIYWKLST